MDKLGVPEPRVLFPRPISKGASILQVKQPSRPQGEKGTTQPGARRPTLTRLRRDSESRAGPSRTHDTTGESPSTPFRPQATSTSRTPAGQQQNTVYKMILEKMSGIELSISQLQQQQVKTMEQLNDRARAASDSDASSRRRPRNSSSKTSPWKRTSKRPREGLRTEHLVCDSLHEVIICAEIYDEGLGSKSSS